MGELLHKQLYYWVDPNREHVSTTWTSFLLQGSHAEMYNRHSPWEGRQGKVALLQIALFLPVAKTGRLPWAANPSPPPFWRLNRGVLHGKTCNTNLMTFRRWLHSNSGNCLIFWRLISSKRAFGSKDHLRSQICSRTYVLSCFFPCGSTPFMEDTLSVRDSVHTEGCPV